MCVGELFPAVTAARKALELKPNWWEAHQTFGRANLQIGEVRLVSAMVRHF